MTSTNTWRREPRWWVLALPASQTHGYQSAWRRNGVAVADLIVALDLASADEALAMVDQLPDLEWAKIGPVLFVREGPAVVRGLKQRGIKVFLDLKWYDIPSTVAGAVAAAADQGIDLATVHSLGGQQMLEAAVKACGTTKLVAVTVLTSYSSERYWNTVGRESVTDLGPEVSRLARMAVGAGVHGVVTSVLEVAGVRSALGPEPWIVTPGIRPAGADSGDQQRTADPGAAVRAGATHLVVGRPITRAESPDEVYKSIKQEMRQAR
ncbi:MAG: orotidine-5'-phosphate decarboxylase [Gemmatimonadota bacterium]|nr:MAG: orotidine-5'-phosphate decarboxylase [Gemmatimonadota bacterium]